MSLIIAFDRKGGELVDCDYLMSRGLPVFVLQWQELQLALLQPIQGMPIASFCATIVQLLATHLNLFASRRLLLQTLETLFRKPRSKGTWPTLREWLHEIDGIKGSALSRLGQYREASLFALGQIQRELGSILGFAASNFFERLLALRGCVVISTCGLSVEMESILTSLVISWVYQWRENADPATLGPLFFIIDDALQLVRGSAFGETEGGINPLSTWSFMGRSRKIGFIIAAQNYSLISPALRNNCDSILCFASYGRDAQELGRDLSLSRDQQATLSQIRPGEVVAIARSTWPLAVYGRVPEIL